MLLDPTTQATFSGELAPDPDSQVQRLLGAGSHPDLFVINKEMARYHSDPDVRRSKQISISVHVLREFLIDPGGLAPTIRNEGAAGKVFIIDEAELMLGPGQNALLKLLEEPPSRAVLILVTADGEPLRPAIRRRRQRVFFPTLSEQAMGAWLKARKLEIGADEKAWLLRFAEGSPGVFLLAKETGLYAWWARLAPMLQSAERGGYRVEFGPAMAELIEAWAKAWVESHDNASKEAANKAGADWMLRLLTGFLR